MDKSKTRGYAFIEYQSHRAAALARRKLVPGNTKGKKCNNLTCFLVINFVKPKIVCIYHSKIGQMFMSKGAFIYDVMASEGEGGSLKGDTST